MSEPKELTFDEFARMCEDAGIAADPVDMEQDFRIGGVIADLVDNLMTSMETFAAFPSPAEALLALKEEVAALEAVMGGDNEEVRKKAIAAGVMAVRFAAEICHDEKDNN